MTPIKVLCEGCGTLFGIEPQKGVLNIKHRDLFRTITGGVVTGPCRKCGNQVKWSSENVSDNERPRPISL